MKWPAFLPFLIFLILISGCASKKPAVRSAPSTPPLVVTPDNSLSAKVISYNEPGQFVILNFPVGSPMPKLGQTLFLYRNGFKVAEIKVTGPQRDNNIAADIITGVAQIGDDVREQ